MAFGFPPLPTPALNPDKRTLGASWVRFLREMYKLRPTQGAVIDGGQLIEDQALTPFADNTITHSLGRTPSIVLPARDQGVECDFLAQKSSTQSVDPTTDTEVIYNTTIHDTGSNYDNTTGRFTAPVDGLYLFHGTFELLAIDNAEVFLATSINGSVDYYLQGTHYHTTTADYVWLSDSRMMRLDKDDTFAWSVWHNDGAARTLANNSQSSIFSGRLIRDTWEKSVSSTNVVLRTTYAHTVSLWVM